MQKKDCRKNQSCFAADTALKTELTEDINDVLAALNAFKATKAQANGLASLDENGKVPGKIEIYVSFIFSLLIFFHKYRSHALRQCRQHRKGLEPHLRTAIQFDVGHLISSRYIISSIYIDYIIYIWRILSLQCRMCILTQNVLL